MPPLPAKAMLPPVPLPATEPPAPAVAPPALATTPPVPPRSVPLGGVDLQLATKAETAAAAANCRLIDMLVPQLHVPHDGALVSQLRFPSSHFWSDGQLQSREISIEIFHFVPLLRERLTETLMLTRSFITARTATALP